MARFRPPARRKRPLPAQGPQALRDNGARHINDLCDLLEVDKPRDPDNYCFERGAKKSGGGDGWKRGFFGWENKKPGRDLDLALKQLTDYALKLESPPPLTQADLTGPPPTWTGAPLT